MTSKNIGLASSSYLRLKEHRGHWHNKERNPEIDDHHGERHRAMLDLQEHLGQHGTSSKDIKHYMGEPTKILHHPDEKLRHEFEQHHHTFVDGTTIWIYEWRHEHDFVYFVISKEDKVLFSAWYHAYD